MNKRLLGTAGEAIASAYLENRSFTILARNYRNKVGEIDIIAIKGERIHFIEVKSRNNCKYGLGREAVTYSKQQTIRRVAEAYLITNGLHNKIDISFDVFEISGDETEHLVSCF